MRNYNFDSLVSKTEQEALKELIFKRARERAQALNDEIQTSYNTNVQNDIMDLARKSFVANKNPFSIQEIKEDKSIDDFSTKKEIKENARKKVEEIKQKIYEKQEDLKNEITKDFVDKSMTDARVGIDKKYNFIGALEFLNTQASISLIKSKEKRFDILA